MEKRLNAIRDLFDSLVWQCRNPDRFERARRRRLGFMVSMLDIDESTHVPYRPNQRAFGTQVSLTMFPPAESDEIKATRDEEQVAIRMQLGV